MSVEAGWEPIGRALAEYQRGVHDGVLEVFHDLGGPDPLPVAYFFRGVSEMNRLEREAIGRARGRVLDLGAGVGSHALALQARGLKVTAVDALPQAVEVMRDRGVTDARLGRWTELGTELGTGKRFDTVLMMMNGAGLAGTLNGMTSLLEVLVRVLSENGQILLDSVNLPEVREAEVDQDGVPVGDDGRYPGELHYQFSYRGQRGDPVPQLFLDFGQLRRMAAGVGLQCDLVAEEEDLYLAVMRSAEDPPSS
jgi:SAM-dependent methyltransferase